MPRRKEGAALETTRHTWSRHETTHVRESGGVGNEGKSRRESEHAAECAIGYHVGEHPICSLLTLTHALDHSDATLGR